MPHPLHHARDDHAEQFLRRHGGGEGLDRDKAEEERRDAATHAEAEANKRGPGRRHRAMHPSAARAEDH